MAFIAGLARTSKSRIIQAGATIYIEIFRGTSLLVQLFWIFFALPLIGIRFSRFTAGVLALGLNIGAYGAEIVRGAITAIPNSQIEAAVALNFSPIQRMLRIVFPQAVVRMLPPFGNLLIELLKATSLVSLISITELTFTSYTLRSAVGRTFEVFTILLVLYFLLSRPIALGVRWLERRREWAL
jgi:polar amino acid transport system permease protein